LVYISSIQNGDFNKSLESWIWDAACSIRGAKDAPKYKDYILPLIFTKRLCDVFDDELNRIAAEVGSRRSAFALAKADHKLVRFYLPLVPDDPEQPVWSVIRKLADRIGEGVTTQMRAIARENPLLQGIIDRVDFNATTHGQRDLDDDRLSNLIEAISTKRLGLDDVEADIIGKSYEYLIRKFAEGGGQSAGEFYTPPEVGTIMSRVLARSRAWSLRPLLRLRRPPDQVRDRDGRPGQEPKSPRRSSSTARSTSPTPGPWPT
jgi:type I restriction enzyme M protein